jgi:hypothetical protein
MTGGRVEFGGDRKLVWELRSSTFEQGILLDDRYSLMLQ